MVQLTRRYQQKLGTRFVVMGYWPLIEDNAVLINNLRQPLHPRKIDTVWMCKIDLLVVSDVQ